MKISIYHILFHCFIYDISSTLSPTPTPSFSFDLPPQASPVMTLVPTTNYDVKINPGVEFRITALAVLFSISGVIFVLILVHQSVLFLINKTWDSDDISKWELQNQNEERQLLLEEIENGIRKPECGIQYDENYLEDKECRRLEPSWIREKDYSMQWEEEDINEIIIKYPNKYKILTANPNRWTENHSTNEENPKTPKSTRGQSTGITGNGKVVMKRDKKIQPLMNSPSSLEPGMIVNIHNPFGTIRPGRILSVQREEGEGVASRCCVEYTDDEGGIDENITKDMVEFQYMTQFHLEVEK